MQLNAYLEIASPWVTFRPYKHLQIQIFVPVLLGSPFCHCVAILRQLDTEIKDIQVWYSDQVRIFTLPDVKSRRSYTKSFRFRGSCYQRGAGVWALLSPLDLGSVHLHSTVTRMILYGAQTSNQLDQSVWWSWKNIGCIFAKLQNTFCVLS